jgi:protein TonB
LRGAAEEKIADEKAEPFEAASPMPDPNAGQAAAAATAQDTSSADLMRQLSAQPTLSSFSFAARTTLAPLTGGNDDNRFMSNVFAKILSKKRYPKSAAARHASGTVMVSFIIDGEGGLVYQTISHSSGEPDLDAEAIAAVKAAAPYPPPPPGAPRSLLATLKF